MPPFPKKPTGMLAPGKMIIRLLLQLSIYLRVFIVFAAAIVLLILAAWCFWWLPQGVDMILKATETRWSGITLLLMLFFGFGVGLRNVVRITNTRSEPGN